MADNTLEALRLNQVGVEAVKATSTLTMDTQPTAGDTVTIGGIAYTWRAIVDTDIAGEISIGANIAAAKVNFVEAINGITAPNLNPNPFVSAGTFSGDVCTLTARIAGPSGNTITLAETFTAGTNIFNGGVMGATISGSMARGTPVAATMRLPVEMLEWGDDDENIYRDRVANGLLLRNRGNAVAVQHGTRFTMPDQAMIWEALPFWLSMIVDGTPVVTGALGGPYTWTFTSDPTANPNLMAATLQRRFNDGLGNTIDERAAYSMLNEFGLSFAVNEQLRMTGAGFARKFATSAITSGLALPTFEVGVSALSKIYVNDTWATVGDTLLAEQVIGWNLGINPGVFPRHTAEGRSTLDFTKHQINGDERSLSLELTCLLDPSTYAAEQAKADAGSLRAVSVHVDGSGGRSLDINMLMKHSKAGLWAPGVDQGQDTLTFSLEEATDATNFLEVVLVLPSTYALAA